MIKIDWDRFIHDTFWFGWYREYVPSSGPRKTYWRLSATQPRWKIESRRWPKREN